MKTISNDMVWNFWKQFCGIWIKESIGKLQYIAPTKQGNAERMHYTEQSITPLWGRYDSDIYA